jgi:hypothetical protein
MIRLVNNYSFRFLKEDAKVFAICRKKKKNDTLVLDVNSKQNVIINPLRYQYYTEPVVGRDGMTRNTLITFSTMELSAMWKDKISSVGDVNVEIPNDLDSIAKTDCVFDTELNEMAFPMYDMKSVSDDLRLALMVVLEMKNDKYEVFYHYFKHKERNF